MKFSSITAPARVISEALNPSKLANRLVETGYRMGGPAGATIAGGVGVIGGASAAYAAFDKLNPIETARNIASDIASSPSAGGKLGAALGGGAELAVSLVVPAMVATFAFESLDAAAQAWDKPQNTIKLDQ